MPLLKTAIQTQCLLILALLISWNALLGQARSNRMALAVKGTASPHASLVQRTLISPDGHLIATIRFLGNESSISVLRRNGAQLRKRDFSSRDGEHGYSIDSATWTSDSQYLVLRLRSSGGHSPMFAPIVFWSRRANRFYNPSDYSCDMVFLVLPKDRVKVSTWPEMKPITVSLRNLDKKLSPLP